MLDNNYSTECLLCAMWSRMPYKKRHTTPTTSVETEGALVVGYWVARNQVRPDSVPPICERHLLILGVLDQQEESRLRREQAIQAAQPPTPYHQEEVARLQARQTQLVAGGLPSAAPRNNEGFALGPGPLTNGNQVTTPPALPITSGLADAYMTGVNLPPQPFVAGPSQPIIADTVRHDPALIDAPCIFCGKQVVRGEVHVCAQASARS